MTFSIGRYAFGLAAIGFGICALIWHPGVSSDVAGGVQLLGGIAVMMPRVARFGVVALGAVYLIFALQALPAIVAQPLVYNGYGNVFEQFSFVAGALMLYAFLDSRAVRLARVGYYAFGMCLVSFALEQWVYLAQTAASVPKWIPPGQMFWAVATTVAFILGAIALLAGLKARVAARFTAAMIAGFGLLVWLPALVADPRSASNWSEGIETFGIAATTWIVVEFLESRRSGGRNDSALNRVI
jgi:uncharacterized membrane protein YphA (DoxX/SURF4 family)